RQEPVHVEVDYAHDKNRRTRQRDAAENVTRHLMSSMCQRLAESPSVDTRDFPRLLLVDPRVDDTDALLVGSENERAGPDNRVGMIEVLELVLGLARQDRAEARFRRSPRSNHGGIIAQRLAVLVRTCVSSEGMNRALR